MESRLADLGPTATSPPPKPPVSPSISPSQSIGSVCVTPSAASSTVEVRLPAIRQSACCAGVGAAVSAASTLVSASNCRGHFLFSQLRKGAWLPTELYALNQQPSTVSDWERQCQSGRRLAVASSAPALRGVHRVDSAYQADY